jgi:hypothetical protein
MPDIVSIRLHLQTLFSSCDAHSDGKVEVAYTDTRGNVNKAMLFGLDEMEIAATFIKEKNEQDGVNAYIGAALRLPNTNPYKRSSNEDFYAAPALWLDLDDEEAVKNAPEIYRVMPPTFTVVTGRIPFKRMQLWWKLNQPEVDKDRLCSALKGLCHAFNGDSSVTDPPRIMRAAGTIAWPYKIGRVKEVTEFILNEESYASLSR